MKCATVLIHSLKNVMFAEGFFCRQHLLCLSFEPTGSKEMIVEKCCAGTEVVCPADSIRAGWCSHSLRHRASEFRSTLQSHWDFLVLHCEFSVDFKNWQVCTVAYKFGLLLPLLFSGDVNKFLSKGNVLSGELFLCYVFRFGFVSSQLAWITGRVSSILYETVHLYVRQNLV